MDEKSCCTKGAYCCCKIAAAAALLLIGGVVGFYLGRHCGRSMCPIPAASQAVQTQAK